MVRFIGLAIIGVIAIVAYLGSPAGGLEGAPRARIEISVVDLGTGNAIKEKSTVTSLTDFQVTVTSNDVDCAGQFVVTALGAEGFPPSVLVQFVPFIVGPAVDENSVTGGPLDGGLENTFKISGSCNSAEPNGFDFASFEFRVNVP